jgi:hypothetical protein
VAHHRGCRSDAAEAAGCLESYILSVMQGVWADGIDTATDAGLRELAERFESEGKDASRITIRITAWKRRPE